MRIKEVNIQRYGPLPRLSYSFEEGIQPIYGPNESGKTLLVDAILKFLIGRKRGWHDSLNRVEGTPAGFILLEDNGKEIKLEQEQTLSDFLEVNPEELKNVFIIRDADLRIDDEDVFYERVQDKIAGLRTTDIRSIQEHLKKRGRLTDGRSISNAAKHNKARSKLTSAKKLQKDVESYLEKIEREGIEELEAQIFKAKTGKIQLETQLNTLEKAKKKDAFEKIKKAIEETETSISKLKEIPEGQMELLDKDLTLFDNVEVDHPQLVRSEKLYRNLSMLSIIGSIITIIFFILMGATNQWIVLIPILMLGLCGFSVISWRGANTKISSIEIRRSSLITQSQRLGLEVNSIEDLRKIIGDLKSKQKELSGEIREKIGAIKEHYEIDSDSPSEFLRLAAEELERHKADVDIDIDLEYDEETKSKVEQNLDEVNKQLESMEATLSEHIESLQEFSNRAYQLNFNNFLDDDLELSIETTESLKELIIEIEKLIHTIEEDANLSNQAIDIFTALEKEEEAKISELFKEGSPASEIFSDITDRRYNTVVYDPEKKAIIVKRPNGDEIEAEKLSRGARDQLYLAIRVALGKKILESHYGFFIMDDAFLSADEDRLQNQMAILQRIAKEGWQIIYFTMKREALEALEHVTTNDRIELNTLQ